MGYSLSQIWRPFLIVAESKRQRQIVVSLMPLGIYIREFLPFVQYFNLNPIAKSFAPVGILNPNGNRENDNYGDFLLNDTPTLPEISTPQNVGFRESENWTESLSSNNFILNVTPTFSCSNSMLNETLPEILTPQNVDLWESENWEEVLCNRSSAPISKLNSMAKSFPLRKGPGSYWNIGKSRSNNCTQQCWGWSFL